MTEFSQITTDVQKCAEILSTGGLVAIPTETVYGLAALLHKEQAVSKIYSVKKRPTHHPLIVHVAADSDVEQWGHFSEVALLLARTYWPGPLTLLVQRSKHVPDWITGGRDSVAIRMPQHDLCQSLLQLLPDAVVAPSANRFGKVSPTTAEHVQADLGSDVDLILDGGPCKIGLESTIVDCTSSALQILRPGAVSAETISLLTEIDLANTTGESRAPGMMTSHYAPDAKIELFERLEDTHSRAAELEASHKKIQRLYFSNPDEYALRFYDELRHADLNGVDIVLAVLPEPNGIGIALRDRLLKAAAH